MLTKAALISQVASRTGTSKAATERFIEALQQVVVEAVAGGDEVKLTGFAAFTPSVRTARTQRHPKTGEMIDVPEKNVVKIRPLGVFVDAVKGDSDGSA